MAEALLFALAAFVAFTVRSTILKLRKVDENIDKLVAIQKAQELINKELERIK